MFFRSSEEVTFFAFRNEDDLGDFKVWVAEEHALFAVVSDGYAGHNDVHIAVVQGWEEAFPWLVFEFDFEVAGFGHGIH